MAPSIVAPQAQNALATPPPPQPPAPPLPALQRPPSASVEATSSAPSPAPTNSTAANDILADSANKIFGFENFGNTCYCNSVLQCLYYSKPFREHVISFASDPAAAPHQRRTAVPGLKPHPFTVDPVAAAVATSNPTTATIAATAANMSHPTSATSHNNLSSGAVMSNPNPSFHHHHLPSSTGSTASLSPSIPPASSSSSSAYSTAPTTVTSNSHESNGKSQASLGRRLSIFGYNKDKDKQPASNTLKNIPEPLNGSSSSSSSKNTSNNIPTGSSSNLPSSISAPNLALSHLSTQNGNHNDPQHQQPDSDHHIAEDEKEVDHSHLLNGNKATPLPNSVAFDTNGPTSYQNSKLLYPALRTIYLGIRQSGQNIPVVGHTIDRSTTPEVRKRAALIKGPIINIDLSFADTYNMKESLFTSLKDIFECMAEVTSQIGIVSPAKLIQVLKRENELFRTSMHQDAHEFLNFLLNEVIDCIDRQNRLPPHLGSSATGSPSSSSRWVHDLFEGLLTSETKCLTCETVSRRDEQFLDLSIDIERNTSVTSCLRQFSASEMLCERNKFNCDHCGGFHEAQKRMKIKKLPKILALHLKRFKYTEDLQRNVKLFHRVVYPQYLRLFNTTDDAQDSEKLYELYAVVVHIGGGPYHGHYVSVVKTENAGWLLFDDEMVDAVDPNYVFNFFGDNKSLATAYVLFYQEISQETYERDNLYSNVNIVRPTRVPNVSVPANNNHSNKNQNNVNSPTHPYAPGNGSPVVSPTPIAASTMTTLNSQVEALEKSAQDDEQNGEPIFANGIKTEGTANPHTVSSTQTQAPISTSAPPPPPSRSVSPKRRPMSAFFTKRTVAPIVTNTTSLPQQQVSPAGSQPNKSLSPFADTSEEVGFEQDVEKTLPAGQKKLQNSASQSQQFRMSMSSPPPSIPDYSTKPIIKTKPTPIQGNGSSTQQQVSSPSSSSSSSSSTAAAVAAAASAAPAAATPAPSHSYGLSRFKSTRRSISGAASKENGSNGQADRYNNLGNGDGTPLSAAKRKTRHLSFGFKKH